MAVPLKVVLPDNIRFQELLLPEPLNPHTWQAVEKRQGRTQSIDLRTGLTAEFFFEDTASACGTDIGLIYVSVEQDTAGQHSFVCLGEAARALQSSGPSGGRLELVPEGEVKALRDGANAALLYARPADEQPLRPAAAAGARQASFDLTELCPHASIYSRNYSVIPELSLQTSQLLILCDEATLCRDLPEERIFEHLKLIVNCHEAAAAPSKYRVGACGKGPAPDIICEAVHRWHTLDTGEMNRKNDEIQTAIWARLQEGTVAVHCLAGIHRAACIVACHFLWRYHALGHRDVSGNPEEIYRQLRAVRPAVSPAYTAVLRSYEAHLMRSHR